jgi:hypothetical protein
MEDNIHELFKSKFKTNFDNSIIQSESKLYGTALKEMDALTGTRLRMQSLDDITPPLKVNTKILDTPNCDAEYTGYWLELQPFIWAKMDELFQTQYLDNIAHPNGEIMRMLSSYYNENMDEVCISALGGVRMIGTNGTIADPLPVENIIPVNYVRSGTPVNSGLTLAKLATARDRMTRAKASMKRYLAAPPEAISQLLDYEQTTSRDYTSKMTIEDGTIKRVYGFEVIETNAITKNSNNIYDCFVYDEFSLKAVGQDRRAELTPRADKSNVNQLIVKYSLGAARARNKTVFKIPAEIL